MSGMLTSKKYDINTFLGYLKEWVDQFNIKEESGYYSVELGDDSPSLYGICDTIFNLKITNLLDEYLIENPSENIESWKSVIQSYQNPNTGWFKEGFFNYGFHFKEHSSAFSTAALRLIGGEPEYSFKIREKLSTKKKVFKWLKKGPEWGLLYWPGSHRGGGIAAIFATLGSRSYPDPDFFDWYFEWLDQHADPEVGFWRLGWIHKIMGERLTKNELGGAVHYYWIYKFLDHPIPYPRKVINSTLNLQNEWGTWDTPESYCIDLDAIFCLLRCAEQLNDYRKEDIEYAIEKYLSYVIPNMNKKDYFFKHYKNTHKLTGYLCTLAEINKYYPELIQSDKTLTQTLDITPWI